MADTSGASIKVETTSAVAASLAMRYVARLDVGATQGRRAEIARQAER